MKSIIITTINEKSKGIDEFQKFNDWNIIIIGDEKSKEIENSNNLNFFNINDQKKLGFSVVEYLPFNHYSRKNIGYLLALKNSSTIIYDTDDDNIPYSNWGVGEFKCKRLVENNGKFINIYSYFSNEYVWPRGFPLDEINSSKKIEQTTTEPKNIGVWQGLADGDTDVDAIYRLIISKNIKFSKKGNVYIKEGVYCPFNSQNTFWKKESIVLAYLPSYVNFRCTDIIRGYIAQRILWERDNHLGFMNATVFQDRNIHNFMSDFNDEVFCYQNVKKMINILDSIALKGDYTSDLFKVYTALVKEGLLIDKELEILKHWLKNIEEIG